MKDNTMEYIINEYQGKHISEHDATELAEWASTPQRRMEEELKTLNKKLDSSSEPKKFITTKELSTNYGISESQQKGLRGRIKLPIPFYQDGDGGKIKYKVSEIDEWMSQQKVKRGI